MKTIYSQIVLGGVFALAIVSDAYAQDRTAVLTTIEVSRLVTNGRPVDHAHLRDHFAALADTYAAKAVRNEAAARTLTGNPNHPPAVSPGALYIRIAEQDRALAAELRELAAYHGSRAAGRTATFPEAASAFERGEGAPAPTDGQIRELVASAQTPADHQALETYFTNEAAEYLRVARTHDIQAETYRLRASDRSGVGTALALHCEREADRARHASDIARAAAAEQRQAAPRG